MGECARPFLNTINEIVDGGILTQGGLANRYRYHIIIIVQVVAHYVRRTVAI